MPVLDGFAAVRDPAEAQEEVRRRLADHDLNGRDLNAPADAPGWLLMETRVDDLGEEQPTGRCIGGLHESILQGDLTGDEGRDFLA